MAIAEQQEIFLSEFWAIASFLLPPMKTTHMVETDFKGREYILAVIKQWQRRVKNWNSSLDLPQEGEKMKNSVIKLEK